MKKYIIRPFHFIKNFKLLSFLVLAIIAGLTLSLTRHLTAMHWILGIAALIACIPLVIDLFEDFSTQGYGIDLLAIISIVTAVVLRQSWAAIVVVVMVLFGEAFRRYAERRATVELASVSNLVPRTAVITRPKGVSEVSISQVRPNDKLLVEEGSMVPVDGIIISGTVQLNQSYLTGENEPVERSQGDEIFSGEVVTGGSMVIRATHTASHSQFQQIIKLMKSAAASHAPIVRLTDRYSLPFTILALALGIIVWVLSHHAIRFLEVIIVATPVPLMLAAPLAIVGGISRASKLNIIIRTGTALEHLAAVRTMAFNKTGTLTSGAPKVAEVVAFHGFTKNEVVQYATALLEHSSHSFAPAVAQEVEHRKLKTLKVRHVSESGRQGMVATISGKQVLAGRLSLMEKHSIIMPVKFSAGSINKSAVFLAFGGQFAGYLTFDDEIRPKTVTTLSQLKRLGVRHFMIITGDHAAAVKRVAKSLDITDIISDALPADKLHAIEAVQNRPVAFVGNGVSDAPVLTTADIGIAFGSHGSAAAHESADIVVLGHDIKTVGTAVALAKHTMAVAKSTLFIGVLLSLIVMAVFATGKFTPIYGAFVQEIIDVVVLVLALRARSSRFSD